MAALPVAGMETLVGDLLEFVRAVDARAVEILVESRTPLATKVMNSVTGLGSATAGAAFVALCYLAGWEREFRLSLTALAISGVVVGTLMLTVRRPYPPNPVCRTGGAETVATSFPSGHAAAAAVYVAVARDSEVLPLAATAVLAVLVAVSRFYLGTHYLSDTVFGFLLGIGAVLAARRLLAAERVSLPY